MYGLEVRKRSGHSSYTDVGFPCLAFFHGFSLIFTFQGKIVPKLSDSSSQKEFKVSFSPV